MLEKCISVWRSPGRSTSDDWRLPETVKGRRTASSPVPVFTPNRAATLTTPVYSRPHINQQRPSLDNGSRVCEETVRLLIPPPISFFCLGLDARARHVHSLFTSKSPVLLHCAVARFSLHPLVARFICVLNFPGGRRATRHLPLGFVCAMHTSRVAELVQS